MFEIPTVSIALGKIGYPQNCFFLFLHGNICCGYSLELRLSEVLLMSATECVFKGE